MFIRIVIGEALDTEKLMATPIDLHRALVSHC